MKMLPYLNTKSQNEQLINQFRGYNHNTMISEDEFYDMTNLSSNGYPLVKTRPPRTKLEFNVSNVIGVAGKEEITVAYTDAGSAQATTVFATDAFEIDETTYPKDSEGHYHSKVPATWETSALPVLSTLVDFKSNTFEGCYFLHRSGYNLTKYRYQLSDSSSLWKRWPIETEYTYNHDVYIAIGRISTWTDSLIAPYHFKFMPKTGPVRSDAVRAMLAGKTIRFGATNRRNSTQTGIDQNPDTDFLKNNGTVCEYTIDSIYKNTSIEFSVTVSANSGATSPGTLANNNFEPIVYLKIGTVSGTVARDPLTVRGYTTSVQVTTAATFNLNSLVGSWVNFEKDSESYRVYVDSVYQSSSTKGIRIARPHPQIPARASLLKDAMFIGTYNVATREIENLTDVGTFDRNAEKHTMLEMGAYVIILPEKIMINTAVRNSSGQFSEIKQMEKTAVCTQTSNLCDAEGTVYSNVTVSSTEPTNALNGDCWLDTTTNPATFKRYNASSLTWYATQVYLKLTVSNSFELGDAVSLTVTNTSGTWFYAGEQKYWVISKVDASSIIIPVQVNGTPVAATITLSKTMPDMDYIIECNNRLWGCRYGLDSNGKFINEIFASKLGDPTNFHYFANTSADSYYVSLGNDGAFTGAVTYQSNPIFFRKDCLHRIYGNYPANYQLKTISGLGVEKGSDKSVVVMNDVVYYNSTYGMCAYAGGTPETISNNFGGDVYKDVVCGTVNHKLWMNGHIGNEYSLFCYDDYYQLWHKEDNKRFKEFFQWENECYGIDNENTLWAMQSVISDADVSDIQEKDIDFKIQSGDIGYSADGKKYLTKLSIRLKLSLTTKCRVEIQYDSDGTWRKVSELVPTGKVSNTAIMIMPSRCDHFAYRIIGNGEIELVSVTKYYQGGSTV